MTQQQLIEFIRRRVPELLEKEIRLRLSDAQDSFCEETHILEGQWRFTTENGRMYYPIDPKCVAIRQADYNNELMNKLVGVKHNVRLQEN